MHIVLFRYVCMLILFVYFYVSGDAGQCRPRAAGGQGRRRQQRQQHEHRRREPHRDRSHIYTHRVMTECRGVVCMEVWTCERPPL